MMSVYWSSLAYTLNSLVLATDSVTEEMTAVQTGTPSNTVLYYLK